MFYICNKKKKTNTQNPLFNSIIFNQFDISSANTLKYHPSTKSLS